MVATRQILLVDDDEFILESMKQALNSRGFTTCIAQGGKEAISRLKEQHFDMIVLDMLMPEGSGFSVLEFLRESAQQVPVLMVTANQSSRHQWYARQLGVADYLNKPFSLELFLERVDRTMNSTELANSAESAELSTASSVC